MRPRALAILAPRSPLLRASPPTCCSEVAVANWTVKAQHPLMVMVAPASKALSVCPPGKAPGACWPGLRGVEFGGPKGRRSRICRRPKQLALHGGKQRAVCRTTVAPAPHQASILYRPQQRPHSTPPGPTPPSSSVRLQRGVRQVGVRQHQVLRHQLLGHLLQARGPPVSSSLLPWVASLAALQGSAACMPRWMVWTSCVSAVQLKRGSATLVATPFACIEPSFPSASFYLPCILRTHCSVRITCPLRAVCSSHLPTPHTSPRTPPLSAAMCS